MRSADDIVERVREATNIIDVVSQYVQLRKRGRNFLGLCPFHNEKTPSFNVLEDKGIFKCFGCGQAGDVFSFLMKMEGLSFPEAIEKLAGAANIPYERHTNENRTKESQELENLYVACKDFATFCFKALRSEQGKAAASYLQQRGFREEILHKYGIGFAPDHSQFVRSLEQAKANLQPFERAGIVSKGERGDYYDRFRERIIFPIYSPTGKVIAFGGRIMPSADKQLAKYINSPETPIYHKSQVLYGLFQAKDAIRTNDFAILVEGNADVIALAQAGFQNTIAVSGTSLTPDQLNLLRRYTRNLVLLFDADLAGMNAALRGIELALSAGFDVSCLVLPNGEDPDSYVKNFGPEAFGEALERRTSFVEAKARILNDQGAFKTPESAARAIRSLVETIAKVPDVIKQELFIRRIAERFKIKETTLLSELQKLSQGGKKPPFKPKQPPKAQPEEFDISPNISHHSEPTRAEKTLLKAFLEEVSSAYMATVEIDFDFSLIDNELTRTVIMHAIRVYEESGIPPAATDVIEYFRDDTEIAAIVTDVMIERNRLSAEWKIVEVDKLDQVRMMARQAAATIMVEARNKQMFELQRQLQTARAEEQEHIMQKLFDYAQEVRMLREGVITSS